MNGNNLWGACWEVWVRATKLSCCASSTRLLWHENQELVCWRPCRSKWRKCKLLEKKRIYLTFIESFERKKQQKRPPTLDTVLNSESHHH
jgi:hypothetical protein